jgi:hypothetical protein
MQLKFKINLIESISIINTFKIFIILAHFSLVIFGYNSSNLLDYFLLIILLLNFNLSRDNIKLFFLILIIISFFLCRIYFSEFYLDFKYLFISLKLIVFLLFFISHKVKNSNPEKYILLVKDLFLISSFLIFSDKIFQIIKSGFVIGLLSRPRLIGEINFDIVLIIVLWLMLKLFYTNYKKYFGYILFIIIILSLSRSGIIGYLLTYYFTILIQEKNINISFIIKNILIITFGLSLLLFIYYLRDPELNFKNIDRIQLLNALFSIYDTNNLTSLFFGHGLMVQLPQSICTAFSFYAEQTTGNENNCNPVILFSYFLRSIFEYGLLVTIIIPYIYYKIIRNKLNRKKSLLLLIPVLSVSLAVGGFYNSISIFSLLLAKNFKAIE